MAPSSDNGLRLLPGIPGRLAQPSPANPWAVRALVILVAIAVFAGVIWEMTSDRRAIRALSREQRLSLVSRSAEELKRFCTEGRPDALKAHCRDVASFVVQFDECKGECEDLARMQLTSIPTR